MSNVIPLHVGTATGSLGLSPCAILLNLGADAPDAMAYSALRALQIRAVHTSSAEWSLLKEGLRLPKL